MVDRVQSFRPRHPADLACMIGLLPAAAGSKILRRIVRPGGHYIIDDCVRANSSRRFPEVPTAAKVRAALVRPGDEVVREVVVPRETVVRQSRRIRNAVERAVGDLVGAVPGCAPDAQAFLAALDESGKLLSGPLRPAIWLVRRRD